MSPVLNNVKIFLYAPIFHPRCGNFTLSRALVIFVDNCENCRYFDQGVNHNHNHNHNGNKNIYVG